MHPAKPSPNHNMAKPMATARSGILHLTRHRGRSPDVQHTVRQSRVVAVSSLLTGGGAADGMCSSIAMRVEVMSPAPNFGKAA